MHETQLGPAGQRPVASGEVATSSRRHPEHPGHTAGQHRTARGRHPGPQGVPAGPRQPQAHHQVAKLRRHPPGRSHRGHWTCHSTTRAAGQRQPAMGRYLSERK